MAKKNENRGLVSLMCQDCKNINYTEEKNKKNTPEKLELNKYCKHCRKTTKHKETKQAIFKEGREWPKIRRK